MVISKRFLLRLFVLVEICLFFGFYFGGSQGLKKMWYEKSENKKLAAFIKDRETELNQLENDIHQWENSPFYKEKWAREQLQMARLNEQVYVITK